MRKPLFLLAFAIACASAPERPATVAQPEVQLTPAAPIYFGSGTSAPASLNLAITNRANVPLNVVRVRVEASGVADYTLRTFERNYRETLGPGETRVIPILTQAYAAYAGSRSNEPLTVRVFVDYEAEGTRFRETSLQQFKPM
jgi:hypothetical protein